MSSALGVGAAQIVDARSLFLDRDVRVGNNASYIISQYTIAAVNVLIQNFVKHFSLMFLRDIDLQFYFFVMSLKVLVLGLCWSCKVIWKSIYLHAFFL